MLGYAFMGKAHSNAFRKIEYMTWPPPLRPRLVVDRRPERAGGARRPRRGTASSAGRPTGGSSSPTRRSACFDNLGPNDLHAEPTIAAAEAGKHVVCEKPLGRDADESFEIWSRVAATGVKHMCAFNYRFVPAVRLARELIEAGELGDLRHFRGRYLQDWGDTTEEIWRFDAASAGSGALGDLAAHVVDLARYLVGEIDDGRRASCARSSPAARWTTRSRRRSSSRAAPSARSRRRGSRSGRRNAFQWEINGTKGSLAFDMERLNELQVFRADGDRARGFKTVLVSEADHPFWEHWWPPGHIIGWGDTFVHELHHFLARDRGRARRRAARSDVRGRLPRGRGLRRDRPLVGERSPRAGRVPQSRPRDVAGNS